MWSSCWFPACSAETFAEQVASFLQPGALLLFSHGFNVHFRQLDLPRRRRGLVAQKRQETWFAGNSKRAGSSLGWLWSKTPRDRSSEPLRTRRGLGGSGSHPGYTFGEETETDLFGEQAVLCGGVTNWSQRVGRSSWRRATTRRWLILNASMS